MNKSIWFSNSIGITYEHSSKSSDINDKILDRLIDYTHVIPLPSLAGKNSSRVYEPLFDVGSLGPIVTPQFVVDRSEKLVKLIIRRLRPLTGLKRISMISFQKRFI
jgi:hypothetical protein